MKKIWTAVKRSAVKDTISTALKAVRNLAEIDKSKMPNAHIQATTSELIDLAMSVVNKQNMNETSNTGKKNKTPNQLQNQYNLLRIAGRPH